jgi:hypothetical protein
MRPALPRQIPASGTKVWRWSGDSSGKFVDLPKAVPYLQQIDLVVLRERCQRPDATESTVVQGVNQNRPHLCWH